MTEKSDKGNSIVIVILILILKTEDYNNKISNYKVTDLVIVVS
jgi:hypothetical protein